MNLDAVPIWAVFTGTIVLVLASIDAGYRLGLFSRKRSEDEKEAPVSGVSGAILGLTAFMLAFTFSMVAERFEARKALVREDANALRMTYLRAAFLPPEDRRQTRALLNEYLAQRLDFVHAGNDDPAVVKATMEDKSRLQRKLWDIAVANAGKDLNSDVAALYIESLNDVFAVDANRIAVGLQARVPSALWAVLYGLTFLGMMSIGYHTGIAASKRSKATVILAVAFALVTTVIALLDRPGSHTQVTQQPLADLQAFFESER